MSVAPLIPRLWRLLTQGAHVWIAGCLALAFLVTAFFTSAHAACYEASHPLCMWVKGAYRNFEFFHIKSYPWTDMSEGVWNGFYIAHGAIFGTDTVVNHFPGIYLILAAFMRFFGLGDAVSGDVTAQAAYAVSGFATIVFQVASVMIAAAIMRTSLIFALGLAAISLLYSSIGYDMAMPMSETFIFYALAPLTALLYRMFMATESTERIAYAGWACGFANLVIVLLGLTLFPSNLFLGLVGGAVILHALFTAPPSQNRIAVLAKALLPPLLASVALLAVFFQFVDLHGLLFWNAKVNSAQPFSIAVLLGFLKPHFLNAYTALYPFGSSLFELAPVLGITGLVMVRQPAQIRPFILFAVTVLVVLWLSQWRNNLDGGQAYKALGGYGLALGCVALILSRISMAAANWRWLKPVGAACVGLLMIWAAQQTWLMGVFSSYTVEGNSSRPAIWDEVSACRLSQKENCRCVQYMVFGPQIFLFQDIRPCTNRYPTFAKIVGDYSETRDFLINDTQRTDVIFGTFDPALMREDTNNIPPQVIDFLQNEATCKPFDNRLRLCWRGEKGKPHKGKKRPKE